jgi:hypothetical protein
MKKFRERADDCLDVSTFQHESFDLYYQFCTAMTWQQVVAAFDTVAPSFAYRYDHHKCIVAFARERTKITHPFAF